MYVAANGSPDGDGSRQLPYRTLQQAIETLPAVLDQPYTILLDPYAGSIEIGEQRLIIQVKGTEDNPLTIKSLGCRATVVYPYDAPNRFSTEMILIRESSYVNIQHVHFHQCMPMAIRIRHSSSYINVQYCEFSGGSVPVAPVSSGVIVLIGDAGITHHCKINYNLFRDLNIMVPTNQHQVVYISDNAHDNTIFGNTIYNTLAWGIHAWHCNYQRNKISRNLIQQYPNTNDNNVRAMVLGIDWDGANNNDCPNPPNIVDNWAYHNYVYDPVKSSLLTIDFPLPLYNNKGWNNRLYSHLKPKDPYWMDYSKSQIENTVVAGDFDNDGDTEMAAFRQDGGNGKIDLWLSYQDHEAFVYSSDVPWWNKPYDVSSINGRTVSGDLNGDGKTDIIAFRDNGPSANGNSTEMDLWLNSSGGGFGRITVWSSSGSYTASRIKDRVVSGDFNGDGYDDLATLYDYGNNQSRIHVWLGFNGGVNYQGSAGWWSSMNYDADFVTNRMVAGDFNGDGLDDIAAVYDDGSSGLNCKIHVFESTGGGFNQNSWWFGALQGDKMSGRVVVGDFSGNNLPDIAAVYEEVPGFSKVKVWTNNGSVFSSVSNFWSSTGYTASQTTDAVVAGRFSQDGEQWQKDGIAAFYNYARCESVRTHVWVPEDNSFYLANSSLGYPWLLYESFHGKKAPGQQDESLSEDPSPSYHVKIYPNPVQERLTVEFNPQPLAKNQITVYNASGVQVLNQPITEEDSNALEILTDQWTKGIYIIELRLGDDVFHEKVIKY